MKYTLKQGRIIMDQSDGDMNSEDFHDLKGLNKILRKLKLKVVTI